jgi:enolase-phosphatase E1
MRFNQVKFVLTDIEGTTTSVRFVYEVLFPYFRENIQKLKEHTDHKEVQIAFKQTVNLALDLEGKKLNSVDEIIETLLRWSKEDRKLTPLKVLQGMVWEEAYKLGEIKGHVYPDVADSLRNWNSEGIQLGVFSSGSIVAQKLLFGHSEAGDLTGYFSAFFDTTTGSKRDSETYQGICETLKLDASEILFLSDSKEELEAADKVGYQTLQLLRPETVANWKHTVADFSEIDIIVEHKG